MVTKKERSSRFKVVPLSVCLLSITTRSDGRSIYTIVLWKTDI
nr:MAG TPA: hypothetical protein [Caudoviricetes sp.]